MSNPLTIQQKSNPTAPGTRLGLWRRSCDQVLASLEEFSQNLLDNIQAFREYGDKAGADLIGCSCIACLAHLAVLYNAVGRIDPLAGETCSLCDSALQRLGKLTLDIHFDEFTYLDLLLGVRPSYLAS